MELIVAVYDGWGIGCNGTQPIALSADRKFFREMTRGAMVIAGHTTVRDFPGGKPLPGRVNVVLSRTLAELPGFTVCHSVQEVVALAATVPRAVVIGGGSVYRLLLPACDTAIVTKVHCVPVCDTFFPDLDSDPAWVMDELLLSGTENGIDYEICRYRRR